MSTGKRLAKRSIVGTRVCAPYDGLYFTGMIQNVKFPGIDSRETLYSVSLDHVINGRKITFEYRADELIGPGFQNITTAKLAKGQRVYITYNGREVSGIVDCHNDYTDEVFLTVDVTNGHTNSLIVHPIQVRRRLDEMRLMESRKSARLLELDTDYSRLACEGQTDQIRHRTSSMSSSLSSSSMSSATTPNGRKRRSSDSSDSSDDVMDDCTAAMILMSLSCSPKSPPIIPFEASSSSDSSAVSSCQSPIPSPGPLSFITSSSAPTWSHLDDHEYLKPREDLDNQKNLSANGHFNNNHVDKNKQNSLLSSPINIPGISFAHQYAASAPVAIQSPRSNNKYMRLNGNSKSGTTLLQSPNKNSPIKRGRGESRKCRKVYGMDNRDLWCTQCKWKKACTRFTD